MGAFLEGFREPALGLSLVSSSYDSEDDEGGEADDEVDETLVYAGVEHRQWYGTMSHGNGAGPPNGAAPPGAAKGCNVAISAGWSLPRWVPLPCCQLGRHGV
jgi:hypothetical protein